MLQVVASEASLWFTSERFYVQFCRAHWKVGTAGVDFQDGMRTLLDLRFADYLLLFAKEFRETKLLDELVTCLAGVGLHLNVGKTKVLTTQSQSPTEVPRVRLWLYS